MDKKSLFFVTTGPTFVILGILQRLAKNANVIFVVSVCVAGRIFIHYATLEFV
jgi:hypothetical protein